MTFFLWLLGCLSVSTPEMATLKVSSPDVAPLFAIGSPQQQATWESTPNVRICASTEVPLYRAHQAIKFWGSIGYEFGEVHKDPFSTCMNPRYGEIIITLPESGFANSHMGATRLYTDNKTGHIVKAKIFILPKYARKDRVLEHEIGHALGWMHYRQRYHIMHPTWYYGGHDTKGLHKR